MMMMIYVYVCLLVHRHIGLAGRVFANGPWNLGSTPVRVILKTFKMALDTCLLNNQQYKVRIKGKWSNPGKGVAPSSASRCSSYSKRSLLFTLDYGRQLYLYLRKWMYVSTPFSGLLHFTLDTLLILLSVKPESIKYHFLSLWYDVTCDWTQVSRTIAEHYTPRPISQKPYNSHYYSLHFSSFINTYFLILRQL